MTDDHDADQAGPDLTEAKNDPRAALMREKKAQLADRVVALEAQARRLAQEKADADDAYEGLTIVRDHNLEGLALARCLNALEELAGEQAQASRAATRHWSPQSEPDRPYVPGKVERVLRHLWLRFSLGDPAAELDRTREDLRYARARIAELEGDIESARMALADDTDTF